MKKIFSKINFHSREVQVGGILSIVLLLLLTLLVYKKIHTSQVSGVTTKAPPEAVKSLVEEIGEKIVLPEDEVPSTATVIDHAALNSREFFKDAQDGDKVLIYSKAKKAILYRPSLGKIVNFALYDPGAEQNTSTASGSAVTKPVRLAILDGTKTPGLSNKAQALLGNKSVNIVSLGNAAGDYSKTVVTILGNNKNGLDAGLQSIAGKLDQIHPSYSNLPQGEELPTGADVVVILGRDFAQTYNQH